MEILKGEIGDGFNCLKKILPSPYIISVLLRTKSDLISTEVIRVELQIIRSKRKTVAIEITMDLNVILRAPKYMSDEEVEEFINRYRNYIEKKIESARIKNEKFRSIPKLSEDELRSLAEKALEVIPPKVEYFASVIGVTYGRITIRNQVSRWGSCSSKGNLNFNCLLMLAPEYVTDYVVVHELCHRKEMNHSERFWAEVKKIYPEYEKAKKWLKENGAELVYRIR